MAEPYDVFISHCGTDSKRDFAVWLKKELELAGVRCFLDDRDLELGDLAAETMLKAMAEAKYGVVTLSKGFFEREWCVKELETFLGRKNMLLVFLSMAPEEFNRVTEELQIRRVWEQFSRTWTEDEYMRVVMGVANFTGFRLEVWNSFWDVGIDRLKSELLLLLDHEADRGMGPSEARLFPDIEQQSEQEGSTPLPYAAEAGNMAAVGALLAEGVDINEPDGRGWTPLLLAAYKGHGEVVESLLRAGADLDKTESYGRTPLWVATKNGHGEVVQHLLDAGADKEKADKAGQTPLWEAAYHGHVDLLQRFLDAGAERNPQDEMGRTPLWIGASRGNADVVRRLL